MVDAEWPLKCDRRAAVLCVADDTCLKVIVEPHFGIKTHRNGTKAFNIIDSELAIVKKQKDIYTKFTSKDVPYKIVPHDRFDEVNGAKVVATKFTPNKTVLFELCGQLFPFSDQFLVPGVNDFSTVTSSVNDRDYMFLGPVAFINHDCKPNVQWHSRAKTLSCVKTIRSICANEEITVWYGPNFFGFQNCQCQCKTCESNCRGFYSKKTALTMDPLIPVKNTQKVIVTQPTPMIKCSDMEAMPMTDDGMAIVNNEDDGLKDNDDDNSCDSDDGDSSDSTNSTTDRTLTMDPLIPVNNTQKVIVTQPTPTIKCSDMEEMPMTDDVMAIVNNEDDGLKDNDDDNSCDSDDGDSSDSTNSTTDRIPDDLYECRESKKQFKYKSWYMNHSTTHSVNGVHQCRYCPKLFKRRDNLERHFLTHFGGIGHDCSVCGRSFLLKHNLKMHIEMQHNLLVPHKCSKCQILFKDQRNLRYHDNVKHTKICPYKCPPCGQAFGAPNQLNRHRRQNNH